jgi:hypothetical protein
MWVLGIGAPEHRCGEGCERLKRLLADAAAKSGGIYKYGLLDAFDSITNKDGEVVDLRTAWNITTIPMLVMFPWGEKSIAKVTPPPRPAPALVISSAGPCAE